MKTGKLLHPIISGISFVTVVTLSAFSLSAPPHGGFHGMGGQASACGSPGEPGTCSRSGCHGAGAGGGADNSGPGTLTLSSVPAMTGNQYVPGTVYNMTVTVAQTGVKRFGFGCEILDNSGSTNGHVNNTAGTVTITDHVHTRIWQAFGTGRLTITHDTMGGYGTNTYSFNFQWTAPSIGFGTVNVYLCGNASNDDSLSDAADDIYSQHIVLTEGPTSVSTIVPGELSANVYPNPASTQLTMQLTIPVSGNMKAVLYSVDGKKAKELENSIVNAGNYRHSYNVSDMAKGIYILKVNMGSASYAKRVVIE